MVFKLRISSPCALLLHQMAFIEPEACEKVVTLIKELFRQKGEKVKALGRGLNVV